MLQTTYLDHFVVKIQMKMTYYYAYLYVPLGQKTNNHGKSY